MMAERENEMRSMIGRLEGYLDGKGLEVNTERTKIMRFKKESGRMSKRNWRWRGKMIEKVKEFKYLVCNAKKRWTGSAC